MLKSLNNILVLLFASLWLVACTGTGEVSDESGGQQATPGVTKSKMSKEEFADFQRAMWIVKSGDLKKGIKEFESLSKKYPNLSEVHLNLGILKLKNKDFSGAEASLLQATQINPKNAIAYNHLGVAYRYNGNFNEAKGAYLKAIELDKAYPLAHLNLGILYDIYFQDLKNALAQYQQYKNLIKTEDKTVDKWIIDLERRVAREKQAAK